MRRLQYGQSAAADPRPFDMLAPRESRRLRAHSTRRVSSIGSDGWRTTLQRRGRGSGRVTGDRRTGRRFNVSALSGTLIISLAVAVVVLLGVLLWRERRAAALARAARPARRHRASGTFRRSRARQRRQRPVRRQRQPAARADGDEGPADQRARALAGRACSAACTKPWPCIAMPSCSRTSASHRWPASGDAATLEGRSMPELVHPDYTDLVREHLRRALERRARPRSARRSSCIRAPSRPRASSCRRSGSTTRVVRRCC